MRNALFLLVMILLLAYAQQPALAQGDTPAEDVSESAQEADDANAEPQRVETDDDSYRDIDDEDFTPSEEIPADQSITFPTDI